MEWGRDRGPGSRPARALRRPHWFPYRPVQGPKLRLNAASAQAIGLALHELATNAGKYGSLSTDRGRVDICWRTDGDALTMSWTERDGPPVSAPKRRGFGHHRYGSDDGAQRRWSSPTRLRPLGRDVAPDLS